MPFLLSVTMNASSPDTAVLPCKDCGVCRPRSEMVPQCREWRCEPCYRTWLASLPKIELTDVGKKLFGTDRPVSLSFRPL